MLHCQEFKKAKLVDWVLRKAAVSLPLWRLVRYSLMLLGSGNKVQLPVSHVCDREGLSGCNSVVSWGRRQIQKKKLSLQLTSKSVLPMSSSRSFMVSSHIFRTSKTMLNKKWQEWVTWDFPGGAVVKNPPANAGDTGSNPSLGRSHMPRSN